MKLESYRCLWGVLDDSDGQLACSPVHTVEEAFEAVSKLGYDGVELPYKMTLFYGQKYFKEMLQKYKLKVNFIVFTDNVVAPGAGILWGGPYEGYTAPSNPGETDKASLIETHLQVWKEQVEGCQFFKEMLGIVNSHSLKDYFTVPMAEEWFTKALAWEKEKGYFVVHEGHRKRFLHSPWVARDFVPKFPDLKLCADLSHWINVAETDTNDIDLTQVIEDLAPRVWHTHCRVGFDHGPQVADPRAPEWLPYMEGHERWWDAIWAAQIARGQKVSTMIAEHGPPNYQPTLTYSRTPIAMIWDVNHWVSLRRQVRYAELHGKENTSKLIPSKTQGFEPVTKPGDSILKGKPHCSIRDDEEIERGVKRQKMGK